jgi:hypothetical protein
VIKDTSPKYYVYLRSQDFGAKKKAVFEALKESVPKLSWKYESFKTNPQYSDFIYLWRYCTDEQVKALEKRFVAIEIKLDVEEVASTFLFPSDELDGYSNNWYSETLLHLQEDALADWAESEGIEEIYRFTLLPTFTPAITIRASEYGIVKKQAATREISAKIDDWILTEETWLYVCSAMNKHDFWTSDSWNTVPKDIVYRDGEILLFEGYKNGKYKFLHDHSPEAGSAYLLQELFLNLKPDSE